MTSEKDRRMSWNFGFDPKYEKKIKLTPIAPGEN